VEGFRVLGVKQEGEERGEKGRRGQDQRAPPPDGESVKHTDGGVF